VTESAVERYLRLGLQLGRHVDGVVDAFFGSPELAAAVESEPPVEPRMLVAASGALLDELEDGWLHDQVVGLRTYAAVLADESTSYADEVEGCYGVRPTYTDEAVFTAAHERLDELLPGNGPLAERYQRWEDSIRVPAEQVEHMIAAVIAEARAWTRGLVELPDGEGVDVEIVHDEPYLAFCSPGADPGSCRPAPDPPKEHPMPDRIPCPDPACTAPAQIVDRWTWESTAGPIEHVKTGCARGHWFTSNP
jgi:hypothetical protein